MPFPKVSIAVVVKTFLVDFLVRPFEFVAEAAARSSVSSHRHSSDAEYSTEKMESSTKAEWTSKALGISRSRVESVRPSSAHEIF
jgi:hypothetical protein